MMIFNKFFYILTIFICLGCSNKKITGKYVYIDSQVRHLLKINDDRSFSYLVEGDISNGNTAGKWQFDPPFLYLISHDSNNFFTISETDSVGLEFNTIEIEDISDKGFLSGYLIFNTDTNKYFFDKNRVMIPPNVKNFKSIEIYTHEKKGSYRRKSSLANFFRIQYDGEKSLSKWYINDTLQLKNNKLINNKFPPLRKY